MKMDETRETNSPLASSSTLVVDMKLGRGWSQKTIMSDDAYAKKLTQNDEQEMRRFFLLCLYQFSPFFFPNLKTFWLLLISPVIHSKQTPKLGYLHQNLKTF
jgi:hypothetical protein